jgi:type I restriction enzyme S subunit
VSEWVATTLGEVMELDVDAVEIDPTERYDIVGVLNRGRGLLYRDAMAGSATSYKTLNRLAADQVVYSRLKAFEGAITVTPKTLGVAYASQEFPTFTCGPSLLPDYFRLVTTTKGLWDRLQNLSTGMGGRRERVKPGDFLTIRIALPSVPEQRRIVDVMAAVDAQIEALAEEEARILGAWRAAVSALDACETSIKLGDLLDSIDAGKSPSGEERLPGPDERAVLKISAVGLARFDSSQVKTVSPKVDLKASTLVREGDILMVRCNAMLDRVGVVCRVPYQPTNLYLCDKTLRLVPRPGSVDPDYLASVMSAPSVRSQIAERTAGSDMRNIGQAAIRELLIPSPDPTEQRITGVALASYLAQADSTRSELAHLRLFRSTLLTALLNQEIEVPDSYDALLDSVPLGAVS